MTLLRHLKLKKEYHSIIHRSLYLLGLATILCGLGWSNILMSIGQFIIVGNWILELDFARKKEELLNNKLAWLLISLVLMHIIGLFWTSDISYGLRDIEKKLPLLLIPIVLSSTKKLDKREIIGLFLIYLTTLFILSVASYFKYLGWTNHVINDKRELSINISHIRYGLNISFAVITSYFISKSMNKYKILFYGLAIWFLVCLVLFELYTGIITILIATAVLVLSQLLRSDIKWFTKMAPIGALAIVFYFSLNVINEVRNDYLKGTQLQFDQDSFKGSKSLKGNYYWNEPELDITENGVYVWRFIAKKEVKKEWNKKSKTEFDGLDKKGQKIETTIYRFLSSKGLKKDSAGVAQLSEEEIKAIENGIANFYYLNNSPVKNRIHKSFYEFENYNDRGVVSGFSLVMRIEYWKTAIRIFKKNWLFGVGTGDVKDAFEEQYKTDNSKLSKKYKRRAHNQFLTFALTFGIVGISLFILYLFYPIWMQGIFTDPLYLGFLVIAALSFLTEDTLETQAGVTFFALFNCLFLLAIPKKLKFPGK